MSRKSVHWPDLKTSTLVGLLAFGHLMAFVDRFILAAVAGPVKAAFRLSETNLGALQGLAFALPYVVAIIPLGLAGDRLPLRRLAMASVLVWTLGGFACAFTLAAWQFWAARALMAAGQAGFVAASLALLNRLFEGVSLATPMSIFTAGSTLGKSVALLAAGFILTSRLSLPIVHALVGGEPWRDVFALTVLPNFILILGFAVVRFPERRSENGALPAARFVYDRFDIALITFGLVAIVPVILIQASAAWTPILFARIHHLTTAATALKLGSLVLICAPFGHLLGGQITAFALNRRVSLSLVIAACLALSLPLSLVFCLSPNTDAAFIAYGAATIILGVAAPAGLTGVSLRVRAEGRALTNALYMAAVTLVGVGLGPTLVGVASDLLFHGGAGLAYALLLMFVVFAMVGAALTLLVERPWSKTSGVRSANEPKAQPCP